MSELRRRMSNDAGVLSFSVNQDASCIAVASLHGIRVFNVEQGCTLFSEDFGAVKIVEMLFRTSLVAYVGAGEQPHLSPRKLILLNTQTRSEIKTSMFRSSIVAVKMNRRRLVVMLETQAIVFELENLQKLRVIDTPPNSQGICAMSVTEWPSYLALPSSAETGSVRLFDIVTNGGNLLIEIDAHKSPVTIMALSDDSSMLATASHKGTLINVFSIPDGEKLFMFRRGTIQASILSMAFTPEECNPRLLAVVGSHGTVHIFKLITSHLTKTVISQLASATVGMLTAFTSLPLDTLVEAARGSIAISFPHATFRSCCFSSVIPFATDDDTGTASDTVILYIASSEGKLYQYTLTGLLSDVDGKAKQTGEHRLLGSQFAVE